MVRRARDGDMGAFALLYRAHADEIFRFVHARVSQREAAEDLTSETFLRALTGIGAFTWRGVGPRPWLLAIARNLVHDHHRARRRRPELTTDDVSRVADTPASGPDGDPEGTALSRAAAAALLATLPTRQRQVLRLHALRYRSPEIAAILGIPRPPPAPCWPASAADSSRRPPTPRTARVHRQLMSAKRAGQRRGGSKRHRFSDSRSGGPRVGYEP
ncbi:hypothetical protein Psuf_092460 [Phytohabitans suffuscus]|uniref:Uncharacterized protein n=1 Tax=Phytohabitans suffuscus TaxID=624315 RepID=A0A6F8Z109_9ACTN|nr:hypothetical protein Psuf_092460 [Phytohabitans suffuscus]